MRKYEMWRVHLIYAINPTNHIEAPYHRRQRIVQSKRSNDVERKGKQTF